MLSTLPIKLPESRTFGSKEYKMTNWYNRPGVLAVVFMLSLWAIAGVLFVLVGAL